MLKEHVPGVFLLKFRRLVPMQMNGGLFTTSLHQHSRAPYKFRSTRSKIYDTDWGNTRQSMGDTTNLTISMFSGYNVFENPWSKEFEWIEAYLPEGMCTLLTSTGRSMLPTNKGSSEDALDTISSTASCELGRSTIAHAHVISLASRSFSAPFEKNVLSLLLSHHKLRNIPHFFHQQNQGRSKFPYRNHRVRGELVALKVKLRLPGAAL